MSLRYFLLSFLLIFIYSSCPEYKNYRNSIQKIDTHCLIGGILTENELKKKLSSCNIYQKTKQQILQNFNKDKNEFEFVNEDLEKKLIYFNYAKKILHDDKIHHSFFIYSYSIKVVKSKDLYNCIRYFIFETCSFRKTIDLKIQKEDIEKWKSQSLNNILKKIKLEFSNSVDEKLKKKFYSDFPLLKK